MYIPIFSVKQISALFAINIIFAVFSLSCNKDPERSPQNGIYNNGILSTGPLSNSGVSAPGGTTWSEAQADPSSNTSNWSTGIGNFYTSSESYWTGDDFTIPAGQKWNISKIAFYGMVYNATTNPFDTLHLQIWNGRPGLPGSSVIYGNATTNVLSNVIDSLIYGISNSLIPSPGIAPDLANKFWKLTANVNINLNSGTYWLTWQTHTISGGYAYTPFVIIKNSRTHPSWNAILSPASGGWAAIVDIGRPATAPDLPQDLPFEIVYTY